ncbi:PASTA domain-containing protein [Ornithinimicrobium cryptoxanthini]|uniref:PASTA domain-containing protein n=1 Tax=Ornithinimicrobium cryptoxanthini TaxID=2934161 RepID=A0ABY4YLS6_9MICO|nr:PASTA domain-containing protein [Ornithinimicrobium cryptoxanthini]USQ77475.1 PASTA domain-containing protein [Ornithinimicrobium cryptoxanthini]
MQEQYDELSAEMDALGEAGGEKAATVEELTAENVELTGQVETLTGDLDSLTSEKDALTDELAGLEQENADLREQIEGILDDIDASVVAASDLDGGTAAAAVAAAEANGWVVIQIPTAASEVAAGTVLSQTPAAGTPMLAGSALAISVATAPEPPPGADAGTIFEEDGNGSATTGSVNLEPGVRHFLAFTFEGEDRHVVSLVDADGDTVAQLVDLNGTTEAGATLPFIRSYSFAVETEGAWSLRVVTLP